MFRTIKTLKDVVDWGLCTGCGACYYACSPGQVTLVNIESIGIRPRFNYDSEDLSKALSYCPGYAVDGDSTRGGIDGHDNEDFGFALDIWEGCATDPEIRYQASSGGILSALATYCLEQEGMAFVLHSAMEEGRPWLNTTVQSRTRSEILRRAGSRYAPASPCDALGTIENSERPCVFIGKPCDTAAAIALRHERPALDRNLGLVLSFFCAGTPATKGTLDLLKDCKIDQTSVHHVRYRGEGWPGMFKVLHKTGETSLSYEESWGRLSRYRPLRCQLCPDGLGRIADISCGDAWESFSRKSTDSGQSLVIVRTQRGREIIHRAMAANYIQLTRVGPDKVLAAQSNLLQKRKELLGRIIGLRASLRPTPTFRGFRLVHGWMGLPLLAKARTVLGTIKRVLFRRLWRRQSVLPR